MIVVYYGVNFLSSCRSISRSAFLSLCPLFIFPLPRPLPASPPLNLALCLCPNLHPPSLPLAIFLHLELSLFCLFSIPRPSVNPSVTPSLSYLSFSSGLSISPRFTRSCFTSPILFPFLVLFRSLNLASPLLLLGAVLLCSRCSARRKYSLFAPPLALSPRPSAFPCLPSSRLSSLSASAHPVSSSIPTYSISRPSAQVNIIPAWFPSLSETSARAVFIFRASVA